MKLLFTKGMNLYFDFCKRKDITENTMFLLSLNKIDISKFYQEKMVPMKSLRKYTSMMIRLLLDTVLHLHLNLLLGKQMEIENMDFIQDIILMIMKKHIRIWRNVQNIYLSRICVEKGTFKKNKTNRER